MRISRNGIELNCKNVSYSFDGEYKNTLISTNKLSFSNIGTMFCPRTGVVRGIDCEGLTKIDDWGKQMLYIYFHYGSDDDPEVNFYGVESYFIKLYITDDDYPIEGNLYIKKYEIYDSRGNLIEEKEF
jgi:hypothetical protein